MMLLNSHVKCSCIFHVYVISFFPILNFSLFLSLSLIDCTIAPKQHKSTPARNPLQGSESSSSFHYSYIQFRDEKAQKDFSRNFQKCGVHSECKVILSDFSKTLLPEVIWIQDQKSLLERPTRRAIVFIQEFYSNIHSIDTDVPQLLHLEIHISQLLQILYPRY